MWPDFTYLVEYRLVQRLFVGEKKINLYFCLVRIFLYLTCLAEFIHVISVLNCGLQVTTAIFVTVLEDCLHY